VKKNSIDCKLIGIVNITPDSFSDGGLYYNSSEAFYKRIEKLRELDAIIELGGESTRPGASVVSVSEELRRLREPISYLSKEKLSFSIDTSKYDVACFAVENGCNIINDISGLRADSRLIDLLSNQKQLTLILNHWRSASKEMYKSAHYERDVVVEVYKELESRLSELQQLGIEQERIVLDLGIGFNKLYSHNLKLLREFERLIPLGRFLLAISRKRFLRHLLPDELEANIENLDLISSILALRFKKRLGSSLWGVRAHRPELLKKSSLLSSKKGHIISKRLDREQL
jgi:dihydropteroate synthase